MLDVGVSQICTARIAEVEIVLHFRGTVPDRWHQLLYADPRLVNLHGGIEDHVVREHLNEHARVDRDFFGIIGHESPAE